MKFTKMQGLGNDYIYFNCFEEKIENPEELSKKISDRHFGIGGDGIILIMPSEKSDFKMRMFNADGSEGKMCGNASRCIAKYVYERGLTDKTDITLETLSGEKNLHLSVIDNIVQSVSVDMGMAACKEVFVDGKAAVAVDIGNPHCVFFCKSAEEFDVEKDGKIIENHPMFPDRTNVEFIIPESDNVLKMRVWERGSGETLACGTGACAAAYAAVFKGLCDIGSEITVKLLGGVN